MPNKLNAKQKALLAAYKEIGVMAYAYEAAKVTKTSHYRWLESSEAYREKYEALQDYLADELEREARRRAIHGCRQYKFDKGRPVYIECDADHPEAKKFVDRETGEVSYCRHYYEDTRSDTLMIFLLKAARPAKFRDNSHVQLDGQLNHSGGIQLYIPENLRGKHGDSGTD